MSKEKIKQTVKGFPLIKFKNKEIIDSLQNGILYLNSLKWFRDYENEVGDIIVGDSYEGMLHINEGKLVMKETGEVFDLNDALIPTTSSNAYVYCMTYINPKVENFEFNDAQKKEIKEFGDTALLILDSDEFIKRVMSAAEKKGYKIYFNCVNYYDENIDVVNVWVSLFQGSHNIAFWKRKSYEHQQEFRFVIVDEECVDDHIELEIGDIRDISKVLGTEQILNAEVERNN